MPSVSLNSDHIFQEFTLMSEDDTKRLITSSNKKSSSLDPIPTKLVIECLDVLLPVITKMNNLSLESGIFPCIWKEADVQPRLKKQGLEVLFENRRPISNLPYVSKLVERTVRNQFHNHLSVHHLYPGNQSAYREFHSTETALLRVKNDVLMNMNKQHVTLLVLLDLSAAFDTVDHALLLQRLQLKFGLSGTVPKWFTSYLSQRTQRVTVGGVSSEKFNVDCGVPPGSCLGPLLFVLYVSELLELIERHLPDAHAYADDIQLYISFRADSRIDQETAVRTVEMCIDDIKRWMLANRLKLNEEKTEVILIGTWQQLVKIDFNDIRVDSNVVTCVQNAKNLACWFDSQMKMDTHVTKCCKAAFFHLYNIRRIRKFLDQHTTQILVQAFVISRLDYCNSLFYGLPSTQLRKLQDVQNAAARLICNTPRFDQITPVLYDLRWLPIKSRIDFKILLITYKALNNQAPTYIKELLSIKKTTSYNLRSYSDPCLLERPRLKTLKTLGDRSFSLAAPTLWNAALPKTIRTASSTATFKKLLKTFLFLDAFN